MERTKDYNVSGYRLPNGPADREEGVLRDFFQPLLGYYSNFETKCFTGTTPPIRLSSKIILNAGRQQQLFLTTRQGVKNHCTSGRTMGRHLLPMKPEIAPKRWLHMINRLNGSQLVPLAVRRQRQLGGNLLAVAGGLDHNLANCY